MLDTFTAALPFFYFMWIASTTPGPNNVMLTASGMNFGFKRTIPHILGICTGCAIMLILCALGIGALYESFPQIGLFLKIGGSLYLAYLAWKIANSGRLHVKEQAKAAHKPMSFIEAVLFQYINPKAIVACLTALSLLPTDMELTHRLLAVFILSSITNLTATCLWTIFGKLIAKLFRDDKTRHVINIILAILLLATIPMMLL